MLPKNLSSIYVQYKTDTNIVASWLATNGQLCQCPAELLEDRPASRPGTGLGRLKGKARRLAKQNAPARPGMKRVLAIDSFIPLAKLIVSSKKPKLVVSASTISILDRAIRTRRKLSDYYVAHGESEQMSSTFAHMHFTTILEKVREILEPAFDATARALDQHIAEDTPNIPADAGVSNPFEPLEIEDLSSEFASTTIDPEVKRRRAPTKKPAKEHWEAETTIEDATFRFRTLIHDLNGLRDVVIKAWKGYIDNKYDLAAVATTTNTAIDLARHLEGLARPDFEKYLEHCRSSDQTSDYIREAACDLDMPIGDATDLFAKKNVYLNLFASVLESLKTEDNTSSSACPVAKGAMDIITAQYNASDELMCCAFNLLSTFHAQYSQRDAHQRENEYLAVPKAKGTYAPRDARCQMSDAAKFKEDTIIFNDYLMEVAGLAQEAFMSPSGRSQVFIFTDEITRGFQDLFTYGVVELWMVFGTQVFLEIHRILRHESIIAMYNFRHYCQRSLGSLLHGIRLSNPVLRTYPQFGDKELKEMNDTARYRISLLCIWALDPFGHIKKMAATVDGTLFKKKQMLGVDTNEENYLLQHHPLLCGLLLQAARTAVKDAGILAESATGAITIMAHFYNACRQQQYTMGDWEDMSLLVQGFQDLSSFFPGGKYPTSPDAVQKCFMMASGKSISNFATNSRSSAVRYRRGRKSVLKRQSPIFDLINHRFLNKSTRADMTDADVESILKVKSKSSRITRDILGYDKAPNTTTAEPETSESHVKRDVNGRVSLPALLMQLLGELDIESVNMSFNLVDMFCHCWLMLGNIAREAGIPHQKTTATGEPDYRSAIASLMDPEYPDQLEVPGQVLDNMIEQKGGYQVLESCFRFVNFVPINRMDHPSMQDDEHAAQPDGDSPTAGTPTEFEHQGVPIYRYAGGPSSLLSD